jgi:putative ABC transport system permease protein
MALLARLRSFMAALVSGRELEREMDEEWRFHLEARADALAAEGVPRDEAVRRARVEFGDPLRWRESSREARGVMWIYDLGTDLRYGLRQLRRAPVFAVTVVVTLALGIGANTLAFSILHAVLVRELPYRNPDRIVLVWFNPEDEPDARGGSTLQNYFAVRDRTQSFEFVGSMSSIVGSIAVDPDDEAGGEPVAGQRIHATLPPVLGVEPVLGTWFTPADDPATAARKLVLSHRLWQQRFSGDPSVIGRLVRVDGQEATVIGVMPDGFEILDGSAQFWTPSRWSEATMASPSRMLVVAARLKPRVTLRQAQAEMEVLAASLAREFPQTNTGWSIRLESIYDAYTWWARWPLFILQGVVALVLLIACANVIGLLLAQASTRQQEFAMRLALGSSRGRLVRQLFAESMLLACIGCICGVVLASAGLRVFMAQNPMTWLPRAGGITLDAGVLMFAVVMSAASTILFGLLPSWTLSRRASNPAIKGVNAAGGVPHGRMRGVLLSSQVAVALVLLIAAGLLANTMVRLNLNRPGIDPTNLLAFQVRLPLGEMVTPTGRDAGGFFTMRFSPRVSEIFSQIKERLSVIPGVQSVAASVVAPATPAPFQMNVTAAGQPQAGDGGSVQRASWFPVSSDYFRTLRVVVRRGREFTKSDSLGSTPVAIVNETLARRLWAGEDPIGHEISIDFVNDRPRQVVGVVADVRETSRQRSFAPHVFVPEAQLPLASRGWFQAPRITMTYLVRTATDPLQFVGMFRSAVAEVYRSQPIYGIRTLKEAMTEQLASWEQYLMLLGAFAGIAALLTLVGIYGLVAYGVGQRTQEIGIRRALGASAGAVLRLVLRQGLILVGIGVAAGVTGSLATMRVFQGLLWGVSPTDPLTFALASMSLAVAALLACYVPARRALAINPIVALRVE